MSYVLLGLGTRESEIGDGKMGIRNWEWGIGEWENGK